jgi:prolyl oligopeptidase
VRDGNRGLSPVFRRALAILMIATTPTLAQAAPGADEDPYLWLEDVGGDKALDWVRAQNAKSQKELEAAPQFAPIRARALEVLDSKERIPFVVKRGDHLYNFWQDENNKRGLWRRTTLAEYRKPEPRWEVVLDLDKLAAEEKENWVWKGADCLAPKHERCMLSLSRGGADATVRREYDIAARAFVKDGFTLPEAKGNLTWKGPDTLYVATDFGSGSLTTSGYPRIVKEWQRGTALDKAKLVYEGKVTDTYVAPLTDRAQGVQRDFVLVVPMFFKGEVFQIDGDKLVKLDLPIDAKPRTVRESLFVQLRSAWTVGGSTFGQGSLLVIDYKRFMAGARDFAVLFEPSERRSLSSYSVTKNFVLVNELDNVRNRLYEWSRADGKWSRKEVPLPGFGTITAGALNDEDEPDDGGLTTDDYFLTETGFLTPPTLYLAKAGTTQREKLKALPAFFDAAPYTVEQFEARSRDGTMVPYFVVRAKAMKFDGTNPTLLYGYGGFEIVQMPSYSGTIGNAWLAHGGVFVQSNIRGGGEFGPRWHQAALKENRQKAFDDFAAIAEDLIARKITSPKHLGIYGGSNGGLLVGAVMLQRPELFRAVVCGVPLLDMKRYNQLLAGASWMAEYGNPDIPAEWDYISKYSPYQNVKAGTKLPRTFFFTSTRDDRVHPGHARKMMARMSEQGHDVLYYENIEGGHAASANNAQVAYRQALMYSFLLRELR